MSQQGRSEAYRDRSLIERVAPAIGSLLPSSARTHAARMYASALGLLKRDSLVARLPHGERVRLLPHYRQLTWNPEEYNAFRADIRPGDTVLDVGANIGAYTVLFAQWVGPHGRVIAFEPAPEPYRALRMLVDANTVADRVTALDQAVSSLEGTAAFAAVGVDGANRLTRTGDGMTVATTTIDAVCRRLNVRPRLIKIDAEGAELDVLRGARQTLARGGAGLRLYVEMHPHLWPQFGASREAIEAELASHGLRAERLDGRADVWNLEGVCLRIVPCGS